MKKLLKNYLIRFVYVFIDLATVYFALFLTCKIRHTTIAFDVTFQSIFFSQNNPFRFIFVLWIVTIILFLNKKSLYQTRRDIVEGFEILELIKSVFLASTIIAVAIYGLKLQDFPRSILLIGTALITGVLSAWRIIKRVFVNYIVTKGYNNFNTLIIGSGKIGRALYYEIKKRPGMGLNVVGYLDDFRQKPLNKEEPDILGKISDFPWIVRREFINKVFITTYQDGKGFLDLLKEAKDMGIAVRVVPHGFEFMSRKFLKYNIGFIPILEYSDEKDLTRQAGKRLFDFVITLILTILLLPAIVIIAILIKLDSHGPVFYLCLRYGRGGKKFNMYKFRSMVSGADRMFKDISHHNEVDGPIFKMKSDPRITKIGKILRKYSLDELPQLFNVIKGDMSLVGPRPLPIAQVEREDFKQLKRLEVRPGITGLWQIRGRSDISFRRLVKWDIWYIDNWSFWLDLNILLQTLPVVIKGAGAY